jgi:hypothetical protein
MEAFLTLTEFSISLAGFTGIVVVFVQQRMEWEAFDKFRVVNALITSIGSAFLSAFPHGLLYLNVPELLLWKIHSIVIIFYYLIAFSSIYYRMTYKLPDEAKKELPLLPLRILALFCLSFLTVSLLACLDLVDLEIKGLNYFMILFLLAVSVFAFSRTIFFRPNASP